MNEATLETNINNAIKKIFPKFAELKITHQNTFNLRLGHSDILVEGVAKSRIGGRLDILILKDDIPLAVLEIKKGDVKITSDDVNQGISYARLLDTIAPLVIITNGIETKYYSTYTKDELEFSTFEEETIQTLFEDSIFLANQDKIEAVNLLIGRNPQYWKEIIKKTNINNLNDRQGDIIDLSYAVVKNFSIQRDIVNTIYEHIQRGEKLILLTGDLLSGKTNIVHQVCAKDCNDSMIPLFIDAVDCSEGIFQYLANILSSSSIMFTKDDIRQWISISFSQSDSNLLLVIDGLGLEEYSNLKSEISELIGLSKKINLSVLITTDDYTKKVMSYKAGRREKTDIGRNAKVLEVEKLTYNEFSRGLSKIFNEFRLSFDRGVFYNSEFRNPRFLRLIVGSWGNRLLVETEVRYVQAPSITHISLLQNVWDKFISDITTKSLFRKLAIAFLEDKHNRKSNPHFFIRAFDRGLMKKETVEQHINIPDIKKLTTLGYIREIIDDTGEAYILPLIPEALATAGAFLIADEFMHLYPHNKNEAKEYLVNTSQEFPYGDFVGAKVIIEISNRNAEITIDIIRYLLDEAPVNKISKDKNKLLLGFFEDVGEFSINIESDISTTANVYPWLILSQLAYLPIVDMDDKLETNLMLKLLYNLGNYNGLLRRPDTGLLKDMKGFHFHNLSNGDVVCSNLGIIEPITFAMRQAFYSFPEEMKKLCDVAIEEKNEVLAYRLNTAISGLETSVDTLVKETAEIYSNKLYGFIKSSLKC